MSEAPQQFAPPAQPPYAAPQRTEGTAIGGLITGILFWPAGLILNPIALSRTKKNGTAGRGLAIAGLILSLLGLVTTIIIIVATVALAGATVAAIDKTVGEANTVSATGVVGDTLVTDKNIAITVSAVTCGLASVGDGAFSTAAQGEFCAVDLTATNQSGDAAAISSSMVKGFIGTSEYSADSSAALGDDTTLIFDNVNPGNSVTGKVYIDVPKGSSLDSIEVDDAFLGASVKFTL
ncbi:DUF4190 domain-containing protein [Subtercola boreus]|nr:DUF4190 domain-containing protein [Subtercola boreus]